MIFQYGGDLMDHDVMIDAKQSPRLLAVPDSICPPVSI